METNNPVLEQYVKQAAIEQAIQNGALTAANVSQFYQSLVALKVPEKVAVVLTQQYTASVVQWEAWLQAMARRE